MYFLFLYSIISLKKIKVNGIIEMHGIEVEWDDYPHVVFIKESCYGTIIGKRSILTTKECAHNTNSLVIKIKNYFHTYSVKIAHFPTETGDIEINNDISILELSEDVEIAPIILPTKETKNFNLKVLSWGTYNQTHSVKKLEKEHSIIQMENDKCVKDLKDRYSGYPFKTKHQLCISYLQGLASNEIVMDYPYPQYNGSPLCTGSTLVGILHFGSSGTSIRKNYPALYVAVYPHMKWIIEILSKI